MDPLSCPSSLYTRPNLWIGQLSPRVIFSVNLSSNFIIFGTHIFKISKWPGVNFNQIRIRKKSLSGELQKTPPSEMDMHMGRANMFWTVKLLYQENLECLGFIFTKYELYIYIHRKTTLNQYFQHDGAAIIDLDRCFFKTCVWPRQIFRRSRRCLSGQKFIKYWQNVYEGLSFFSCEILSWSVRWFKKNRENLKIAAIIGSLPVQYWKWSSFDNGSSV